MYKERGGSRARCFRYVSEELIPDDHVCWVIDGFVDRLDMADLGFERAEAADTGRPGDDPRDLLKLAPTLRLQPSRGTNLSCGCCSAHPCNIVNLLFANRESRIEPRI
jgi:hypothetical protein